MGQGAYATVWEAVDEDLQAPVAIKVLADNWSADPEISRRFIDEARILRQLDDAHIVDVYAVDWLPDGRPYFVMQYADGGTLHERMQERFAPGGLFSVDEAVDLSLQLAECLEVVHALGVAHRDLKPSNVLFRRRAGRERMMLADFGIARRLSGLGEQTIAAGTPRYMAPEQADQLTVNAVDHRGDVYAAAVILFELLSGEPPFAQTPRSGSDERPPKLFAVRPDVPARLENVLRRGLEIQPDARWQTAREWADALAATVHRPSATARIPAADDVAGRVRSIASEIAETIHDEGVRQLARAVSDLLGQECSIGVARTEAAAELLGDVDLSALELANAMVIADAAATTDGGDVTLDGLLIVARSSDDPELPAMMRAVAERALSPVLQVTVAVPIASTSAGGAAGRAAGPSAVARAVVLPESPTTGDLKVAVAAAYEEVRGRYRPLRARLALDRLDRALAAASPDPERIGEFQDELESIRLHAGELEELLLLDRLRRGQPAIDETAVREADRVLGSTEPAERAGVSRGADAATISRAAAQGAARWRAIENEPTSTRDVRHLAAVVSRAYERLWRAPTAGSSSAGT